MQSKLTLYAVTCFSKADVGRRARLSGLHQQRRGDRHAELEQVAGGAGARAHAQEHTRHLSPVLLLLAQLHTGTGVNTDTLTGSMNALSWMQVTTVVN